MSKLIPLRNRKGDVVAEAIVDDADFEWLSQWRWYYFTKKYAARNQGKQKIYMHKLILGITTGREGDHINRNKLDNRRENLRPCTRQQNQCNATYPNLTSRYRGVTWNKRIRKWQAQIQSHLKNHYLGVFQNESDAARAYDNAAKALHGQFASLNLPESEYPQ